MQTFSKLSSVQLPRGVVVPPYGVTLHALKLLGEIDCDWNNSINIAAYLIRNGIDVNRALCAALNFTMKGTLSESCKKEIKLRFEFYLPQDFLERYIPKTMKEGVEALTKYKSPVLEYVLKTYETNHEFIKIFRSVFSNEDIIKKSWCPEFCGKILLKVLDDYECFDVYGRKC